MDTRTKILTDAEAVVIVRDRSARVVTGHFDPLLAADARKLTEIAGRNGRLVIVVTNPERPILAERARAELVAALECVEYVVLAGGGAEEFLKGFPAGSPIHEEQAHAGRTKEFVRRVQSRRADSPR